VRKREERFASVSVLCFHCGERVMFEIGCSGCGTVHGRGYRVLLSHPELMAKHFDEECFCHTVLLNPKIQFLEDDGSVVYRMDEDQPRRWAYFDEAPSEYWEL
jgi:hypothetical protein